MPATKWVIAAAGAAAIVVLFLVLRPPTEDPTVVTGPSPSPGASPAASATASPTPTSTRTPTITLGTPDAREVEVEVEEGRARGPRRVIVAQGRRVAITVESDVSDQVHVHGYDLVADVAPGTPARIRFRATVPGIFEVELKGTHLLLLRLEVTG